MSSGKNSRGELWADRECMSVRKQGVGERRDGERGEKEGGSVMVKE